MLQLLTPQELSTEIHEPAWTCLQKGYPKGTTVYQATFYPSSFVPLCITVFRMNQRGWVCFSSIEASIKQIDAELTRQQIGNVIDAEKSANDSEWWLESVDLQAEVLQRLDEKFSVLGLYSLEDVRNPGADGMFEIGKVIELNRRSNSFTVGNYILKREQSAYYDFFETLLNLASQSLTTTRSLLCLKELNTYFSEASV